jgi:hypothetical protein
MTVTQQNQVKAAAEQLIANFGQAITYRPLVGDAYAINAIVKQSPPTNLGAAPNTSAPVITVTILNAAKPAGIEAGAIDTGGDRVDIEVKQGAGVTTRKITKFIFHNAGLIKLEVR